MSRFLALFMLLLPSSCEPSPAGQPSGGRGGAPASAGAKGAGVQEGAGAGAGCEGGSGLQS